MAALNNINNNINNNNDNKPREIKRVVSSERCVEGGGFVVRRALGSADLDYADPFLMLDHFGPVHYEAGEAVGAPDHPHRGFETVTYVLTGAMQHKDSRGNQGDLQSGDVQWMTAGSGVVHSEMPADEIMEKGGTIEGFQLWVNLPKKDKMIAPRYQDIRSKNIPEADTKDGKAHVRIIAGESLGKKAVIDTRTPIMFLDIRLAGKGSSFDQPVPANYNGFVYVYHGSGAFGSNKKTEGKEGQLLVLDKGESLHIESTADELKVLLIAGVPLGEPVARYGPFVMNTQQEIRQAFADYQSGKMGAIDGSEERYEQTRKAQQKSKGPKY